MNELRIILDGTTLEFGLKNDGARRGTFFVTYNLITELSKRDNVELCFYLNKNKSSALKHVVGVFERIITKSKFLVSV